MMTNVGRRVSARIVLLLLSALLCTVAPPARAHSSGDITSDFLGPKGCNACHLGGQAPTVTLTGPSLVTPGSTSEYTLTITNIGSQIFGGLDAYAPFGTLSVGGSNAAQTQLRRGANGLEEITHHAKKPSVGGATRFSFLWTAPGTFNSVTLNAWGNAVNGDGFASGDAASFATLTVMSSMPGANPTDTPGPTPTPSPTPEIHDSVVAPIKPLNVTIASGKSSAVKTLSVKVTNADLDTGPLGRTIMLTSSTDCPDGVTISPADFGTFPPGAVTLTGGKAKAGKVTVTVPSNALTSLNHAAATRCTVAFLASSPNSVDPTPSNASVAMELNVINKTAPDQATIDESFVQSPNPLTVSIPKNAASVVKTVKLQVGNGDIVPVPENPGDAIAVTASDGDCPAGTVGTVSFVAGSGNQVVVKGGKKQTGLLPLTINAAAFTAAGTKSPSRCTAVLTAMGPANPDPDPSNNTTKLVIDVVDKNDF